ncbi:dynamin family protein [Virgibacillus dakarensis]|uniref:dynamin family protein n=1 Tax=Cytobacillus kochii TaxID=859143 RepID=UPI001BE02FCD|nr:dynamin family protein [Cytobacillus kochii]MBT2217995.1 dynamin family protein [Virgibacillus dakarensis]MCA1025039.1 dynamin family protein [Cytobacillus kochii]
MALDLKNFRQDILGKSQAELATMLEVSRDKVVRMENEPGKIELDMIIKLAQVTGQTLEELTGYSKKLPNTFSVLNKWEKVEEFKNLVNDKLLSLINDKNAGPINEVCDNFKKIYNPAKPKIAVLGMSDAGKSTFINSLLGSNELPAYWTPATSTNVHIKHVSDRPEYLKEDVIILDNENNSILIENLTDPEYYEKHKVSSGNLDLLKEFCTRKGMYYEEDKNLLIITYLDKEILKVCDLIDVPGFGTGDRTLDNTMANSTQKIADIVIYLSPSNAFLRGEELQFVRNTLNILEPLERKDNNIISPLGNFYVVASQAMAVDQGNLVSLKTVLDEGANRLYTDINPDIWEKKQNISGYEYSLDILRGRFFTFATDKHVLRDELEIDLKRLLENIPSIVIKNFQQQLNGFFSKLRVEYQSKIDFNKMLLNKRDEYVKILEETITNMPQEERINESLRKEVLNKIRALKSESLSEYKNRFNRIINEEHILGVIKTNKYSKKKQDLQRLSGYISGELESKLENVLVKKSEELSDIIDTYLKNVNNNINNTSNNFYSVNVYNNIAFDVKNAFASGLTGLAAFGGLAIWASTLGNLGGYILVTQSVGLLSSIGISVGGTAAAVSAVASIGGPVTLGIALAVIASLSTFAITSGTWKKSISKKIVKEYNKQNALSKYETVINSFWKDTERAFEKADDEMKLAARKRIQSLNNDINTLDDAYLSNKVKMYNKLVQDIEQMIVFLDDLISNTVDASHA